MFYFLLFLILSVQSSFYQPEYFFEHITVDQGLTQNCVNSITNDQKGYLWFATLEGVNRYDGYRFKHYKIGDQKNNLSGNRAYSLLKDGKYLWIALFDGGINRIDINSGEVKRFYSGKNGLNSNQVVQIIKGGKNRLWIATNGGGVNIYDKKLKKFQYLKKNKISSDYIRTIYKLKNGDIIIGTKDHFIDYYKKNKDKFINYNNENSDLKGRDILNILEDSLGTIWIATREGWLNYKKKGQTKFKSFFPKKKSPIRVIFEDRDKNLWIGTENGLFSINRERDSFVSINIGGKHGLSDNYVRSIYQSDDGLIWIGTLSGGVNKFNPESLKIKHYKYGENGEKRLLDRSTWAFYQDNNELWISTSKGINRIVNGKVIKYTYKNKQLFFPRSNATTITKYNNELWFATYGDGLYIFNQLDNTFVKEKIINSRLENGYISHIFTCSRGYLWIGTRDSGLLRYNSKTKEIKTYKQNGNLNSISSNNIRYIMEDLDGEIWIGTYGGGVNRYDYETEQFISYKYTPNHKHSLSNNSIFFIYQSSTKDIWIGTEKGICQFKKDNLDFKCYSEKNGLSNNVIYSILEDSKGYLWLSTNNGINRFNPADKSVLRLNKKDGLEGNQFHNLSALKIKNGDLMFGGSEGISHFNPNDIKILKKQPKIVLTSIKKYNQELLPLKDNKLKLTYKDKFLIFEFSVLDFLDPGRNKYFYKMDKFDNSWIEANNRHSATYTSLPGGNYKLKIKGVNSKGIFSEKEIIIPITITPPFYKTKTFLILSIIVSLVLIYIFIKLRTYKMAKDNQKLSKLVDLQTRKLQKSNQELKEMALKDQLTGLKNRHYLKEIVEDEIIRFANNKARFLKGDEKRFTTKDKVVGIYLVDMDHFKEVNDHLGHDSGDMVLKQLSKILLASVRKEDSVVRWGGEEFLIILKDTDPDYLDQYAKLLNNNVSEYKFLVTTGETISKTCSIGYLQFPLYPNTPLIYNLEHSIALADLALYKAKEGGRDQAVRIVPANSYPRDMSEVLKSVNDFDYSIQEGYFDIESNKKE